MSLTGRTFNWNAYACNYSGADVYLGLAPGLEDVAIDQSFGPQALVAYPGRCIPITTRKGSAGEVPLRLYALRDSAACDVTHLGPSDVEGFHRAKLTFQPAQSTSRSSAAAIPEAAAAVTPPVIAFLITIGLTPERERHFFEDTVGKFLDHSWSNFPNLLREVGCAEPHRT